MMNGLTMNGSKTMSAIDELWKPTQNEDFNYVIECADLVGIKITEKTAVDFKLIAEITRRMREQYERH